jgi:hypothetical protein
VVVRREVRRGIRLEDHFVSAEHGGVELDCQLLGSAQCTAGERWASEGGLTTIDRVVRCLGEALPHALLRAGVDTTHVLPGVPVGRTHVLTLGSPIGGAGRAVGPTPAAVVQGGGSIPADIHTRPTVAAPLIVQVVRLCEEGVGHGALNRIRRGSSRRRQYSVACSLGLAHGPHREPVGTFRAGAGQGDDTEGSLL